MNTSDDFKFPKKEAIIAILSKLGIDQSTRFNESDQDIEYTSCRTEEIDLYISLYTKEDTSLFEKRVLGCYFLECLNDYLLINKKSHLLQDKAFELLYSDLEIHDSEIKYWSDTSISDQKYWWPITEKLITWNQRKNGF